MVILQSSDFILFYVSTELLIGSSTNSFKSLLPITEHTVSYYGQLPILELPEPYSVLNIVLHAAYNISCSRHRPTFEDIELAISASQTYGISVTIVLSPGSPFFETMLKFLLTSPIDVYALAARYDLTHLAKVASSRLLTCKLSELSDEMAEKIGARYLKKLFSLHLERQETVKHTYLLP